jgi:hypothetical protein
VNLLQEIFRCCWEIQEAVANYKRFPDEFKGIQIGEFDWREELGEMIDGAARQQISQLTPP